MLQLLGLPSVCPFSKICFPIHYLSLPHSLSFSFGVSKTNAVISSHVRFSLWFCRYNLLHEPIICNFNLITLTARECMEFIDDDDDDGVIVGEVVVGRGRGVVKPKTLSSAIKCQQQVTKRPFRQQPSHTQTHMNARTMCVCVPRPLSQCDRRMSHLRLAHSLSACQPACSPLPEFVARHM